MFAPLYKGVRVADVPSSRLPVLCFLDPLSYDAGTALNQHWFSFWSGWRRVSINVLIHKRPQIFFSVVLDNVCNYMTDQHGSVELIQEDDTNLDDVSLTFPANNV